MSKIMCPKCPVCGGKTRKVYYYDMYYVMKCCSCAFSCDLSDLLRITAAMELREAVLWMNECEDVECWACVARTRSVWGTARNLLKHAKAGVVQLMVAMQ